jgi:hypothetical protein
MMQIIMAEVALAEMPGALVITKFIASVAAHFKYLRVEPVGGTEPVVVMRGVQVMAETVQQVLFA